MSIYSFTNNQRFAVYKAFNGRCQWCYEPVDFKTFHVDHVLPEELLNDSTRLKTILHTYSLPDNFSINDYENWIPAHSFCNQGKSDKVYEGAPFIRTILDKCAKNKPSMQRMELKLKRDPQKAELMAKVQAAIEINLVNIQELQNFILRTDFMDSDDEELNLIKQQLEQRVDYQVQQMVKGISDMVSSHASEIVHNITSSLGKDWQRQTIVTYSSHPEDSLYKICFFIQNNVNPELTSRVIVMPDIVNNHLVIKFREEQELFDTFIQNIDKIDWQAVRNVLKKNYLARMKAKMK